MAFSIMINKTRHSVCYASFRLEALYAECHYAELNVVILSVVAPYPSMASIVFQAKALDYKTLICIRTIRLINYTSKKSLKKFY
jgi:hypothetical protein